MNYICRACGRRIIKPRIDFSYIHFHRCDDYCCDGPAYEILDENSTTNNPPTNVLPVENWLDSLPARSTFPTGWRKNPNKKRHPHPSVWWDLVFGQKSWAVGVEIVAILKIMKTTWHPISTFPKDGKFYIARDSSKELRFLNEPPNCVRGIWHQDENKDWHGSFSNFDASEWTETPKQLLELLK